MANNIDISIGAEKVVGSEKPIDFSYTETIEVDSDHCMETELVAGASDVEFDLFVSSLITAGKLVVLETDVAIKVRIDNIANTQIDVNSIFVLTSPATKLYISVPGSANANLKLVYGGIQ
jgi:hypothetical protein